jgi:hypothetical protein
MVELIKDGFWVLVLFLERKSVCGSRLRIRYELKVQRASGAN